MVWAEASGEEDCTCSRNSIQTFRGNPHRRLYGHGYIPATLKLKWRFKTTGFRDSKWIGSDGQKLIWHGTGWSGQAAVVGDRVWLSSVGGYLHCLDRRTGRSLWKFWAGGSIKSSVAYWNGRVYFGSRSHKLFCLDANTGKLLWKFHTPRHDVDSTPVIWKGKMYWGGEDGYLYAMNPITGAVIWKYKTMGSIESSPTIVGDHIYINSYDGHLHSVDLATGQLRWRFVTGDDTDTTPTYYRGVLYLGAENGLLYAVDAQTGELLWQRATDGGIWSSSAVAKNRVYVGSNDRRFYALDAQTGRLVWKRIIQEGIWASPVWVDGRLLFGDWAGYIYVLRDSDGFKLSSYKTGAYIVSTAAVIDGHVYVGSRDGYFYCFGGSREEPNMSRHRKDWGVYTPRNVWTKTRAPVGEPSSTMSSVQQKAWLAIRRVMQSSGVYERVVLARLLKAVKKPETIHQHLLRALAEDVAGNVRLLVMQQADHFGKVGASVAMKGLEDPEHRVRAAACDALARLRWQEAADAIEKQVWSESAEVQMACGRALFALGKKQQAHRALRRFVWGGLYGAGRGQISGCPSQIAKRYHAREEFGKQKYRSYPRQKRALIFALLALANQGDRCAQRALLSRWFGCRNALGQDKAGYCSLFRDWQGWVKRIAPTLPMTFLPQGQRLRTLRQYGLARHYDKNLRIGGIHTLARWDIPERFPLLLKHARHDDYPVIRILALDWLKRLHEHPTFPKSTALRTAQEILQRDRYVEVRVAAVALLGVLEPSKVATPLLQALQDRASQVRAAAMAVLPQTVVESKWNLLQELLASPSAATRCDALQGAGRTPRGLGLVSASLQSADRFLQRCAIRALLHHPQPTSSWKELVQQSSQHPSTTVSLRSNFALLTWP